MKVELVTALKSNSNFFNLMDFQKFVMDSIDF